jgi:cell division protein FtsZ
MPGLINLDFSDVRSVMSEMGKAMMGTGEATGDNRAIEAAEAAIANPLLDNVSMKGARGVLINITGGRDMTLFEVDEAANRIREEVDPDANIIFGSTFSPTADGMIRVSVVATGIDTILDDKAAQAKSAARSANAASATIRTSGGLALEDRPANLNRASSLSFTPVPETSEEQAEDPISDDIFIAPEPAEPKVTPRAAEKKAEPALTVPPGLFDTVAKPQSNGLLSGLFGKKQAEAEAPAAEEIKLETVKSKSGKDLENELEIPAFLRRKN